MITETIAYTDHDGNDHVDILHFHISEATYLENLDLGDRMQEILNISQLPQHEMTTEEKQKMLDLLKRFMSLSYGLRTPEGGFDQDDPVGSGAIWKRFRISSAYNAFLMSLFRPEPTRAAIFMYRVLPEYLRGTESDIDWDALDAVDPTLKKTFEAELAKDKKSNRLPAGTRIVDDVPYIPTPLRSVPDQTGTDETPDYDAMLEEANQPKRPIKQHEHDFMKAKLKPEQFADFMATRVVMADPTE